MSEQGTPIDLWTAIVLGVVQGATEFLPISSDGHIAFFALLLGHTAMPLSMVVVLHVGTLLATVLAFRREIAHLASSLGLAMRDPRAWLASSEGRACVAIAVASIPTAIVGLLLRDAAESFSHVRWIVGACLLITAICVASTRYTAPRATRTETATPPSHAFWVGIAQGLAVLPGLSRSGSTIATLMLLGNSGSAAFRLSFLMSLPAVFGAVLLELRHPAEVLAQLGLPALLGASVSFVVGLASLVVLRRLIDQGRLWAFALYLAPLGLALIGWDAVR